MNQQQTLLLGARDIARCISRDHYFECVRGAFALMDGDQLVVPEVGHIPVPAGAVHIKSAAMLAQQPVIAVKINANFPDNPSQRGLPTIQGTIALIDGRTGVLLALMDSAEVTTMRTAAATAVAASVLARPDSRRLAVIGCGVQARAHVEFLRGRFPLESIALFDRDADRAAALQQALGSDTPNVGVGASLDATTVDSDIIVTCTSSKSAFLATRHVRNDAFVAAVGADNNDKQELMPELLAGGHLVVDVLEQCARIGELHHALDDGVMDRSGVYATLTDIVSGRLASPPHDRPVIFDSTGTASQDVAAAAAIFENAMALNIGMPVSLAS